MSRTVKVNETGDRCGEDHPAAKIPDREVEIIRRLRDVGVSYAVLMIAWSAPKSTIAGICQYRRRAVTPAGSKTLVE